jgi:hypothetical protein
MTEIANLKTSTTTTTIARAYGARAATAPLAPRQTERRVLAPTDVRIEIRFCGTAPATAG